MPVSPRHGKGRGDPAVADRSGGERDRALKPLAGEIRTRFILAYRGHHRTRTGRPSRFGSRLVPRWDGGKDGRGVLHRAIWYDVARLVLAERVDPDDLIEAAFTVADCGCLPQPTSLLSPDVLARARAYLVLIVEEYQHSLVVQDYIWNAEVLTLMRHWGMDVAEAASRALRNVTLEMGAVFRYCRATEGGDAELARLFEEEAVEVYLSHRRAYDRAWGELIPATLKEHVDRLLRGG